MCVFPHLSVQVYMSPMFRLLLMGACEVQPLCTASRCPLTTCTDDTTLFVCVVVQVDINLVVGH
jgi:hypothetical protein